MCCECNEWKVIKIASIIFLVITIIVLLILAAVSIATLTGENGILTRANDSRIQTEIGEEKEAIGLAYNGAMAKNNGTGVSSKDLNDQFELNERNDAHADGANPITVTFDSGRKYTVDSNGNITEQPGTGGGTENPEAGTVVEKPEGWTNDEVTAIADGDGNVIPLPDGFYYVGGTNNKEETENIGIVISDNQADANKGTSHEVAENVLQGNQFVWVPVEEEYFERYDGYYNGEYEAGSIDNCAEPYPNGYTTEQDEYDSMKASASKYNGFYVGRYEAGTSTERTENSGITDSVVVKQGANVYNYIGWSNSNDMTVQTEGAVQKSKGFGGEKGYSSVTSTLIYGVQWDAMMQWIDPAYRTGSCESDSFVRDSSEKGYYNQLAPTVTGSSSNYAVNNIYDLGGNVEEWTMESYYTNFRICRGRGLQPFWIRASSILSRLQQSF